MRTIISFTVLLMAFLSISVNAQNKTSADSLSAYKYVPVTKFDPARNPAADLKAAEKEAQRTGKRILLDVGGDWCIWCHRLDDFFKNNADVDKFMHENFVVLKINYSRENMNGEFLSRFPEIEGYPHIFILDKNGKLIKSKNTGELENGKGHDHDKVMTFLKKFAPKM